MIVFSATLRECMCIFCCVCIFCCCAASHMICWPQCSLVWLLCIKFVDRLKSLIYLNETSRETSLFFTSACQSPPFSSDRPPCENSWDGSSFFWRLSEPNPSPVTLTPQEQSPSPWSMHFFWSAISSSVSAFALQTPRQPVCHLSSTSRLLDRLDGIPSRKV